MPPDYSIAFGPKGAMAVRTKRSATNVPVRILFHERTARAESPLYEAGTLSSRQVPYGKSLANSVPPPIGCSDDEIRKAASPENP